MLYLDEKVYSRLLHVREVIWEAVLYASDVLPWYVTAVR